MSEAPAQPVGEAGQARSAPLWFIGLVAFLYTIAMAVLIQFVILPNIVPQWQDGHGLLRGGDSAGFHSMATEMATKIRRQGWSAWEWAPFHLPLPGILGAVYAATVSEPWVMIPINAAFNALAVILLVLIVESIVRDRRTAAWCAVPFLFYPSALLWNAQIHNDVFFIPGMLLVLYGWIVLSHESTWYVRTRPGLAWILILGGAELVWLVRPYGVQMIMATGVALAFLLSVVLAGRARKGGISRLRAAIGAMTIWCILASLYPLSRQSFADTVDRLDAAGKVVRCESAWTWTKWLPRRLDSIFFSIAQFRQQSSIRYPDARSNIDTNVEFHCAMDLVAHIPRAAQIAFFAPFPSRWTGRGGSAGAAVMRPVATIETLGVYTCLIFSLVTLWRWRRRESLWLAVIFCSGMMVFYALVVCNVGTIYRVRYGFLMTWVAFGVAGMTEAIRLVRHGRGVGNGRELLTEDPNEVFRLRTFFPKLKWFFGRYMNVMLHPERPVILIYQMGKVGSLGVRYSIEQSNCPAAVFHFHAFRLSYLDICWKKDLVPLIRFNPLLLLSILFVSLLNRVFFAFYKSRREFRIIGMVRDPVARNVSAYFQHLSWRMPQRHLDVKRLARDFLARPDNKTDEWFDDELRRFTGIDVLASGFDVQRGYQIYQRENMKVLMMRTDRLNEMQEVIGRFIGVMEFALIQSCNVGSNKWYAEYYRTFQEQVVLPADYVARIADSAVVRRFFSEAERRRMRGAMRADSGT